MNYLESIKKKYGFSIRSFGILVSSGASAYHTWAHINKVIEEKGFDVSLHDVTEQIGILSVQGPNRYRMCSSAYQVP